jgi:hypothetical protein
MASAISALMFLDSKGKPVLFRDYRCHIALACHGKRAGVGGREPAAGAALLQSVVCELGSVALCPGVWAQLAALCSHQWSRLCQPPGAYVLTCANPALLAGAMYRSRWQIAS